MAIPQLQNIKYTKCPECDCTRVKSVKIDALHTCGEWNEYLEFDCGAIYHYFPNFQRIQVKQPCREVIQHAYLEVKVGLSLELRPETDIDKLLPDLKIPDRCSWNQWDYTQGFWGGVRDVRLLSAKKMGSKLLIQKMR